MSKDGEGCWGFAVTPQSKIPVNRKPNQSSVAFVCISTHRPVEELRLRRFNVSVISDIYAKFVDGCVVNVSGALQFPLIFVSMHC